MTVLAIPLFVLLAFLPQPLGQIGASLLVVRTAHTDVILSAPAPEPPPPVAECDCGVPASPRGPR